MAVYAAAALCLCEWFCLWATHLERLAIVRGPFAIGCYQRKRWIIWLLHFISCPRHGCHHQKIDKNSYQREQREARERQREDPTRNAERAVGVTKVSGLDAFSHLFWCSVVVHLQAPHRCRRFAMSRDHLGV